MASNNHRDDLKGDLLAAAETVLAAHGHEVISMRRLAADVGVSSGAPYRHFRDRRALLLELALAGFGRLIVLAEEALAKSATPGERLGLLAEAFLAFCAAEPHLAALMYESELTRPVDPALAPGYRRAFDMLTSAVASGCPTASAETAMTRTITFWSTLYGLAGLSRNQLLEPFAAARSEDWRGRIIEEAVSAITR